MPSTITGHLVGAQRTAQQNKPFEIYQESLSAPNFVKLTYSGQTNVTGDFSFTAVSGTYQFRVKDSVDKLRFLVPEIDGSYTLVQLLLPA